MAGCASLGNAYMLQQSCIDLTSTNRTSRQQSLQGARPALPVYLHEKGWELVSEDHYLFAGMTHPTPLNCLC